VIRVFRGEVFLPSSEEIGMRAIRLVGICALFGLGAVLPVPGLVAGGEATALRFEVTVARGLLAAPQDGRVLVVLGRSARSEPRLTIGEAGMGMPPFLGRDANGFAPGQTVVLDRTAAIFPLASLSRLPKGDYFVQAVFDYNRDLRLPNAPLNLVSEPVQVSLDPAEGGTVKLELTRKLPADELPPDSEQVKFLKFRSAKLSRFHGRPIYLRTGIILPAGHAKEKDRKYPLRVTIGGYGTRCTSVLGMMHPRSGFRRLWNADATPRMILVHLDGAGPFGDPYQLNSVNNGPYGDAVTQELIPFIEKRYRGIGKSHARFLEGASTGGWVSLALQIFYPDFFNGAWSHCPDPVDFRAFELINLYKDDNAYVNRFGFERPAARTANGDVLYTMRHEVLREIVLGRGDKWALSGKDWGAWNAAFGPRGRDGLPVPVWDGKTGKIDRKVVEHWQKYDLRLHLSRNAAVLAPKLRGKLRIWVGEVDDYFLNNAVELLDAYLQKAKPAFDAKITFTRRGRHDKSGQSEKEMMEEMAAAAEAGEKAETP
jgi:hypothetical protein